MIILIKFNSFYYFYYILLLFSSYEIKCTTIFYIIPFNLSTLYNGQLVLCDTPTPSYSSRHKGNFKYLCS